MERIALIEDMSNPNKPPPALVSVTPVLPCNAIKGYYRPMTEVAAITYIFPNFFMVYAGVVEVTILAGRTGSVPDR